MAFASFRKFQRDEGGAVFLEFTVAAGFFLALIFGTVEFSLLFYQWNTGTKATQLGARLAAVSKPVDLTLANWTGLTVPGGCTTPVPGDILPVTCGFTTRTCQGISDVAGTCTNGTYVPAAMNAIVYGRAGATATSCNDIGPNMGMCDVFDRIRPQNVQIKYEYTGLGYAGRPSTYADATGAPVPTITVSLVGLNFNFVAINSLTGIAASAPIPSLSTTITGEDLRGN